MEIMGTGEKAWKYMREKIWIFNTILRLYGKNSFAQPLNVHWS